MKAVHALFDMAHPIIKIQRAQGVARSPINRCTDSYKKPGEMKHRRRDHLVAANMLSSVLVLAVSALTLVVAGKSIQSHSFLYKASVFL